MGGAGKGKLGAVCGERGTRTWDGGGARSGARESRSGRSGALGGCGGASGSKTGASERLSHGGAVWSVRAEGRLRRAGGERKRQGVPRPRGVLARGAGGLWGVDDGAVEDWDADGGLGGVVLGGRSCGAGSRWGEGGSGCVGLGVLAWVWVRVWVRAGSLLLPSYLLWFLGLCGLVLVMLLLVVVVLLLLQAVLLFWFRFWFRVGFWVGVRFGVEEDLVPEVRGHRCWVGGFRGVLPRCLVCLSGGRGASGSLACGCRFGFGRGFVDVVGREGGVGGGGGGCP